MNIRIKASTHHNQGRFFFATGGAVAADGSAGICAPHLVQKLKAVLSSLPQPVQNAVMATSCAWLACD
jgi:hypothetical protein